MTLISGAAPKIEALLFDLGGVVIDIDVNRIFQRWAQHAGCTVADVYHCVKLDEMHDRYERGEIDCAAYFAHVGRALGSGLSEDQLRDGWNAIFIGEMPGIGEVLQAMAPKMPLYCLSNTNPAHELYWRAEYAELLKHFREIFVSSTLKMRKPSAEIYDHAVNAIGVAPAQIMFFDDLKQNVDGACARGLRGVQVQSVSAIESALAGVGLL